MEASKQAGRNENITTHTVSSYNQKMGLVLRYRILLLSLGALIKNALYP